jgi:N-acetylglucosaminyldiphosphoundecaprenol N-acetyl-beta-D-mannosaminyltransferase
MTNSMTKIHRVAVLGVPVDVVDWPMAIQAVTEFLGSEGQPETVIALNPEKVMAARLDRRLLEQIRSAGLLLPDGIGVVWASRLLGLGAMERVPGSEMMPEICKLAVSLGKSIFLLGASEDTNAKVADALTKTYPGIQIAGRRNGYFSDDKSDDVLQQINDSGAKILFVALGSPKQELWMEKYLPQLSVRICQGVGGTFDVLAGNVRRAPVAFRALNLEWFYRLITNPARAARQRALPAFAWAVVKERLNR